MNDIAEIVLFLGLTVGVLTALLYLAFNVLFGRVMEIDNRVRALMSAGHRARLPASRNGLLTYGKVLSLILAISIATSRITTLRARPASAEPRC
ncbi:MAG: hypothetical protein HYY16_10160 [Planctomycetes bacterium]|nr:hypothetical protein [Planctomycetota bacterium]